MFKTISIAFLFLVTFNLLASEILYCKFTGRQIEGIHSITLQHNKMVINNENIIELDPSEINCSSYGRQLRLDGSADGYQVILKSCTSEGVLEGRLIDNIQQEIGDINCYPSED